MWYSYTPYSGAWFLVESLMLTTVSLRAHHILFRVTPQLQLLVRVGAAWTNKRRSDAAGWPQTQVAWKQEGKLGNWMLMVLCPRGIYYILPATWKSQTQHIGCLSSSLFAWWVSSMHFCRDSCLYKMVGFYKMHMRPSPPNPPWLQNDSPSYGMLCKSSGDLNIAKWFAIKCIMLFWACVQFIPVTYRVTPTESGRKSACHRIDTILCIATLGYIEPSPSTPSNYLVHSLE